MIVDGSWRSLELMIIYQNLKGNINVKRIQILNKFLVCLIMCQNKVHQIFKNSIYKPINEIKTHIIQGKNETHLGGAIINERFEYPRYTSYMVSSWLVHFFTLKYNSLRPSHPDSWEENSRHLISFKHWNEKKS